MPLATPTRRHPTPARLHSFANSAECNHLEVQLFPNMRRPGVGLKPRRESHRPLLPQHARNCPVLEAGSAVGFLVYPPLEPHESFHVAYEGEGRYQFVYYTDSVRGKWEAIFTVVASIPVGGFGMF